MIDPTKITNYYRTDNELEEFLLFAVCVAGKGARQQAEKLDRLLFLLGRPKVAEPDALAVRNSWESMEWSPLMHVQRTIMARSLPNSTRVAELEDRMRQVKLGQYRRIARAFEEIVLKLTSTGLREGPPEYFEEIHGIGMKTSRFFIVHSRRNARHAVLDTHILKWLAKRHPELDVPRATPSSKRKYLGLEALFLEEADKAHIAPAALDLMIWNEASRGGPGNTLPTERLKRTLSTLLQTAS